MKLVLGLLLNTLTVLIAGYLLPDVVVESLWVALVVAVVLGVLNTFLRPILKLLALPITVVTLGLFSLVINAFIIWLVTLIVPGFDIGSLTSIFLFGVIVSLISWFFSIFSK